MSKKSLWAVIAAVISCIVIAGVLCLVLHKCSKPVEEDEPEAMEIAYSDIISNIVVGYQTHWKEILPEESGISSVFRYESEFGGFVIKDINGDGIDELLLGDYFGPGNYQLYDIFTFDGKSKNPVHLLCGGERDFFRLNGEGIIIENGSNSAEDSFTKYYKLVGTQAKEYTGDMTKDIMEIELDWFLNYVSPLEK